MTITAYDVKGKPLYDDPKMGGPAYVSFGGDYHLLDHELSEVVNDTSSRAFCGPTAVAALTGIAISKVTDTYRFMRDGPNWKDALQITTTYWHEMERVLHKLGFCSEWENVEGSPTVGAFINAIGEYSLRFPRAVFVTGHVVAISGSRFCDTFTHGKVVGLDEAPGRRKRVKRSLRLTRFSPPDVLIGYRPRRRERWER